MIESNFLTLGGGGYQQMELVIAYALTILVTIALIVLGSHRKQIKNRGTSGGSSDLQKNNEENTFSKQVLAIFIMTNFSFHIHYMIILIKKQ